MKSIAEFFTTGRGGENGSIRQVFAATNNLAKPGPNDMPFETPAYSRFVFDIMQSSNTEKKHVMANIPQSDVAMILWRSNAAMKVLVDRRYSGEETENSDVSNEAIFSERFKFGLYSGKCIYDIVGDDPKKNVELLVQQKEFLEKNLAKFPANKRSILVYKKAIEAINNGSFVPQTGNTTPVKSDEIVIYEEQNKPLKTRTDKEGRVFVYGVKISCKPAMDLPWIITIMNCFAPLEKQGSKELPKMADADKHTAAKLTVRLSDKEYCNLVSNMEQLISAFKCNVYMSQMQAVDELRKKALENNK